MEHDDRAIATIKRIYDAQQANGIKHFTMVSTYTKFLTDRLFEVNKLCEICTDREILTMVENYADIIGIRVDSIEKETRVMLGLTAAAEEAEMLGSGAADAAQSFMHTTALIIVALCIDTHCYLDLIHTMLSQANACAANNKNVN